MFNKYCSSKTWPQGVTHSDSCMCIFSAKMSAHMSVVVCYDDKRKKCA